MRLWHIWAGKDHQGPKNSPKYFANCSNHISKDSRSMFARQPDKCFNIVNKVVKQDLKWQRSGLNLSQSLWQRTKGMTVIMYLVCKSKPENSSKVLHTFNTNLFFLLIALNGSKTDYDGSKLRPFCKFSCCDERSWLLSRERSLHYKLKRCLKCPFFEEPISLSHSIKLLLLFLTLQINL